MWQCFGSGGATAIAETREVAPGVTIDLDAAGNCVGMEVLGVRLRAADMPRSAHSRSSCRLRRMNGE